MRRHDHYVWPHVKLLIWRLRFTGFGNPSPFIHVGDSNRVDMGRTGGKAVFHPLQKDLVETPRLVVRIPRDGGEATPFVSAFTQNTVLTVGSGRPIEKRRIFCDECRTRSQRVRHFLCVSYWNSVRRRLSV